MQQPETGSRPERRISARTEMLNAADAILKANPEPRTSVRIRYRGARPAWNWLAKQDRDGAAALWFVARQRLPQAANDNLPPEIGLNIDRTRKDGRPRGKNPDPRSLKAYMALPPVQARLGDAEPEPARTGSWDAQSRGITIKPQRPDMPFHRKCRWGFFPTEIAEGASFLGAMGGLSQPKMGKSRGDVRRIDAPDVAAPPAEIDTVIETILSGGNVADVGAALGAKGGNRDRRGGAAILAAGKWAMKAVANDNFKITLAA